MKKALIFSPYLDTLGGGERYFLCLANTLTDLSYEVDVAWPDKTILDQAKIRFGINFNKLKINASAFTHFTTKTNLFAKYQFQKKYNLIFFLSDGSLPFLFAGKNFVHFQYPFRHLNVSLIDQFKIHLINKFIYNSQFTQKINERHLPPSKSFVLYPPIDTLKFKSNLPKDNIILSVGRFDSPSHNKRQDVLISAFKKVNDKHYKLILAGGLRGNETIINNLKRQSQNYQIEFVINPDFNTLKNLYAKAKIYWHAAGFEVDETENPENVEHFGMTTVEAMAAGCVPVVINKGGQKEIITSDTGFLCNSINDLVSKTELLLTTHQMLKSFSDNAAKRANKYCQNTFVSKLQQLVA